MKKIMLVSLLAASTCVFAIDGVFGVKSTGVSSFNKLKKDLNPNLKSGFNFQSNKSMEKINSKKVELNGFITFQKGNVYYHIPNRNKVVLQKFKTPVAPVIR
jgi:hypothetical protein